MPRFDAVKAIGHQTTKRKTNPKNQESSCPCSRRRTANERRVKPTYTNINPLNSTSSKYTVDEPSVLLDAFASRNSTLSSVQCPDATPANNVLCSRSVRVKNKSRFAIMSSAANRLLGVVVQCYTNRGPFHGNDQILGCLVPLGHSKSN